MHLVADLWAAASFGLQMTLLGSLGCFKDDILALGSTSSPGSETETAAFVFILPSS